MKIKFGSDGYIEGYVEIGDMEGAVEFEGEIPEGFGPETCRFYHLDNGALVLDSARQQAAQDAEAAQTELASLYLWFSWYDQQVAQYLRSQRQEEVFVFGIDMFEKSYQSITELDAQATTNQLRIQEIRGGE